MGFHAQLTTASDGPRRVCKKIFGAVGGGRGMRIDCFYFPEPTNQSTKIVFIQVMRELLDGVAQLPSKMDPGFNYQDADTTASKYHVDYFQTEKDPYYNGDDPQDHDKQGSAFPSHWYDLGYSWMWDEPGYDSSFTQGGSKMKYEFRTAAFSAAGADAGTYYQYQDWTYEMDNTGKEKTTLGTTGFDPGQDFKDAVTLWCGNRGFKLPTPLPPLPPPAFKGAIPYRVQSGDTVEKLALKFYGNSNYWPVLFMANYGAIGPGRLITPGQVLVIP